MGFGSEKSKVEVVAGQWVVVVVVDFVVLSCFLSQYQVMLMCRYQKQRQTSGRGKWQSWRRELHWKGKRENLQWKHWPSSYSRRPRSVYSHVDFTMEILSLSLHFNGHYPGEPGMIKMTMLCGTKISGNQSCGLIA